MSKKHDIPASSDVLAAEAQAWDTGAKDLRGWIDAPDAVPRAKESTQISIRVPAQMLAILKAFAEREGVGYQALMKRWLHERIREERERLTAGRRAKAG